MTDQHDGDALSRDKTSPSQNRRSRPEERRSSPRVEAHVAGHVVAATDKAPRPIRTLDVSCSGSFCRASQYTSPLTRLRVALILPFSESGRIRNELVELEGVIARVQPDQQEPGREEYDFGIFFSGLSQETRTLIARFVSERIEDTAAE